MASPWRDAWRSLRLRSGEFEFAWGPAGSGTIRRVGALELALAAGPGGRGTLWIADLGLEDESFRGSPAAACVERAPGLRARAGLRRRSRRLAQRAFEGPGLARDRLRAGARVRRLDPRLGRSAAGPPPAGGGVRGRRRLADRLLRAAGPRASAATSTCPGGASRWLRVALDPEGRERAFGIATVDVRPPDFARSIDAFFAAVAAHEPRGLYPALAARRAELLDASSGLRKAPGRRSSTRTAGSRSIAARSPSSRSSTPRAGCSAPRTAR